MIRFATGAALTGALLFAGAGGALAQEGPGVTVEIGPRLQQRAADLGQQALSELRADLRDDVVAALKHVRGPEPVQVDLVIEDAVPNRPTMAQLGANIDLSYRSFGLGGARVSGRVTYAGGVVQPLREQFFESDLRNEVGATSTWYDASRAFDEVAHDIARGRLPSRFEGPGPTGGGHFGDDGSR